MKIEVSKADIKRIKAALDKADREAFINCNLGECLLYAELCARIEYQETTTSFFEQPLNPN